MGTIQIDGSTPKLTIGNATAEDATILFDGNAQDFYIALDDSADDLLIGLGSTVGTTPAISIDENLAIKTYGDITMTGTTPVLTIGDAGAEDTAIVFDGNAQDFYIALDDSADDLLIGKGSTVGTTPAIAIDSDLKVNIPVTTASTSASTGSLTTGGGAGIGADLYVGDDAYLITDSAVLGFGADKDTLLTHTDGTGLTLNSTNKLCFNDASQFVQGSSATVLSIGATDEIDLTATAIDINGTCDISGTFSLGGTNMTATAAELNLLDGGTSVGSSITIADADGFVVNDGGTMKTIPATDIPTYVGGGITVAGQWRLTTDFTGDADPIASNWEEVDTDYSRLGSAVTESSGIFTMPSTGVYMIVCHTSVSYNGENNYHEAILQGTTDGFSSDTHTLTSKYSSSSDHGTTSYYGASCHAIYDVTNTSNYKIKFRVNTQNNSATTKGSSANTQTSLTFIRLGDT